MSEYYEMPHERADDCAHAGVGKACAPCRRWFALLSDETVERAARGIHASHDRGWHFEAEDHAVQGEYRDMARAALSAALGEDENDE